MKIPPFTIKLNQVPQDEENPEKQKKSKKHKHKHKHHKHHHHHHHHHNKRHHNHHHHNETRVEDEKLDESMQLDQKQADSNQNHENVQPQIVSANEEELIETKQPEEIQKLSPEKQSEQQPETFPESLQTQVPEEPEKPLKQLKPVSSGRLAFLRMQEDGSTTLSIISQTPHETGLQKVINLEQICGQLVDGTETIPSDIDEDELKETHQVKPIEYIETSVYGTHLPVKDSTFASLTKEDSETLLEVYGNNETCFEYAKSIQEYASGANYCMGMVDSLLDLLTDGKHAKEAIPIRKNIIDGENEVQSRLDEISRLLEELKTVQEKRLSSSAEPVKPDQQEISLAESVTDKLAKLIKEQAKPGDISDSALIFKTLGITIND